MGTGKDLCLTYVDSFDGFSPVTEYIVNITDGTGLFYNFTQNKGDETICVPIPKKQQPLLSDNCGNLTLKIRSRNMIGISEASTLQVQVNSSKF